MALSNTPDSEHILEIAICSKNKQSLYEVFHLYKRITSGMCMPPSPNHALTYSIFAFLVINYDQVNS